MNEELKKVMGQRIKNCRKDLKLSQEGLAEKLDMKRTNIANYEAGRVVPPGNVLLAMSEVFNVTTDYILGKSNHPLENTPDPFQTWLRQGNDDLTESERDELAGDLEDYFQMRRNRILKERKEGKGEQ